MRHAANVDVCLAPGGPSVSAEEHIFAVLVGEKVILGGDAPSGSLARALCGELGLIRGVEVPASEKGDSCPECVAAIEEFFS